MAAAVLEAPPWVLQVAGAEGLADAAQDAVEAAEVEARFDVSGLEAIAGDQAEETVQDEEGVEFLVREAAMRRQEVQEFVDLQYKVAVGAEEEAEDPDRAAACIRTAFVGASWEEDCRSEAWACS